ncbi:MAG: cysteine desulfurase [Acidobacteria bacterium]|nr:cysteine desulfurase [Acidobacteriota bacterium]
MRRVYLDNSATTRVDSEVIAAMLPYLGENFGNASSTHYWGQQARQAIEDARRRVAASLNATPGEIIFVSGGTESDNLAIKGVAEAHAAKGRHLITSRFEHSAVLNSCADLESRGWQVTYLPVYGEGVVRVDDLRAALTDATVLVTIMHANNEIGTIQPIAEIAQIIRERREAGQSHLFLHTDAVQTVGKIPVDVRDLGVDLLSCSSHKFNGPKGCGVLYVRRGVRLHKQLHGGHHERDLRSGTENVAQIVGLARALELATADLPARMEHSRRLRDRLEETLLATIPHVRINGDPSRRVPGVTNLNFDFVEGEGLQISLDLKGIGVSTGSACSSGATEPSHVLVALGLDAETGRGTIRFSFGRDNVGEDVDYVVSVLPELVDKLRKLSPRAREVLSRETPQPAAVHNV